MRGILAWLVLVLACTTGAPRLFAQAQPVIESFTPTAGTPSTDTIQINGSGFSVGTITVLFWNGIAAVPSVVTDSQLQVIVPAGARSGPLGVRRDTGTIIYTANDFTVIGPGPYVTDFSPNLGSVNDILVLNGVHLSGVLANGVQVGGAWSTDATPNAAGTQVTLHVPVGAAVGTAPLKVRTSAGTSNTVASFTVIGQGPYISAFSPDFGSAGTTVLIDGFHLAGTTSVNFNGVPGVNLVVKSDTLVQVDAPPNVSTGPIAINTLVTSSNFFVPPTITSLSRSSGRTGTNVTIYGTNFRGATSVRFNGTNAPYTVVNNTNIQATVPNGAATGPIRVDISPYFSCSSSPVDFVIAPTIYGFSPNFGRPGTSVTITGANLNVGTPVVRFNGVQAAAPTGVSFGQLTAVVPSGATTTGPISVSTTDGAHTNASNFYLPATITSFTPTNSAPGSRVQLTGLNFTGATDVSFNGTAAADFAVSNNTTMGVTVPSWFVTGPISVTTPAGTTNSTGIFYGAPVISSFSPAGGLPGTNVTILGTNFLGARAVRFGAIPATITGVLNDALSVVVPPGVITAPITVEGPAGTNTSATSFIVDYLSNLETWITDSPDPVFVTSNLVYSLTMINHGPYNAPNVRLTNTLPVNVALVSASMPVPWVLQTNGNVIVATATNIINGGTSTLTITVQPQQTGTLVSTAVIASDYTDPIPANNSSVVTTYVLPLPVLSVRWWTNAVRLYWASALTNFVLQSKTNLTDVNWGTISNTPTVSGNVQYLTDPTNSASKYYRLKSQ